MTEHSDTRAEDEPDKRRDRARSLGKALRPWFVLALICVLFSLHPEFRSAFWRREYLADVIEQSARNIVLAVGLSFVIFTGGIDLSVGSVLALSGVGAAMALTASPTFPLWLACLAASPIAALVVLLANRMLPAHAKRRPIVAAALFITLTAVVGLLLSRLLHGGVKVEFAIAVALMIGLGCGLINGVVVSAGGVPAFVATLGMLSAARGLTLYATGSQSVPVPFDRFRVIGVGLPLYLVTLIVVAIGAALLTRFRVGRYILAIGGNEQATRLAGVPVKQYKTVAYLLSGFCASVGAVLVTAKFGTANTGAGAGAELEAIAAVVIGGAGLSGGSGSIVGALVGALTITIITNGLVLVGIEPNLQQVILGGVIVLTVFLDKWNRRRP